MATRTKDDDQDVDAPADGQRGIVTRPNGESPTAMAEQHRAITEVQAALTIAASNPRDEIKKIDQIITSCQRVGVAEEATYLYSRGGTEITGPSIRLMELIAQKWGNIEWGFRELARYHGVGGRAGESQVEAFAWDLESNSKAKRVFTVEHKLGTKNGMKSLLDPRDIYEYVANIAQRRVRTCLENVIPRDVTDRAVEECAETLKANFKVTPDVLVKLLDSFQKFDVTKSQIEARIQRRLDALTPAQYLSLRKIYKSMDEGMSVPADWFAEAQSGEPQKKSGTEAAKESLRKGAVAKPAAGNGNTGDNGDSQRQTSPPQSREAVDTLPEFGEAREPGDEAADDSHESTASSAADGDFKLGPLALHREDELHKASGKKVELLQLKMDIKGDHDRKELADQEFGHLQGIVKYMLKELEQK